MRDMIGLGVIGNFANHLEQAGEAADFACIATKDAHQPKGIFPFYVPNASGFLGRYCLSNDTIILPQNKTLCVQAEPEVALECEIVYDDSHAITHIIPKFFMAFNDASVRNDNNATKLSQKKNFSPASKGYGEPKIPIPSGGFSDGGVCDSYSIASFITTDNNTEPYGELSPLGTYSYFYDNLISWIIQTLNTQQEVSTLQNLAEIFKQANYPKKALITIGATRYVPQNAQRMLKSGDELSIIVFNHNKYDLKTISQIATHSLSKNDINENISILRQKVL